MCCYRLIDIIENIELLDKDVKQRNHPILNYCVKSCGRFWAGDLGLVAATIFLDSMTANT